MLKQRDRLLTKCQWRMRTLLPVVAPVGKGTLDLGKRW